MRTVAAHGGDLASGTASGLLPRRPAWRRSRMVRVTDSLLRAVHMLGALPRCTPTIGAFVFLGAFAGYGMALSGKTLDVVDAVAREAGLAVQTVEISGQAHVQEADVLKMLDVRPGMSLLAYDLSAGRERLLANPWIAAVSMAKLYPGALKVSLTERQPFALWQQTSGDPVDILDKDGRVIVAYTPGPYASLPLVIGVGADTRTGEALAIIKAAPDLAPRVRASILVTERRWDLVLDNGVRIMLPQENPGAALASIAAMDKAQNVFGRDITVVDLRLPDRVVLRLSDPAAQGRAKQMEERMKAEKGAHA